MRDYSPCKSRPWGFGYADCAVRGCSLHITFNYHRRGNLRFATFANARGVKNALKQLSLFFKTISLNLVRIHAGKPNPNTVFCCGIFKIKKQNQNLIYKRKKII